VGVRGFAAVPSLEEEDWRSGVLHDIPPPTGGPCAARANPVQFPA